MARTARWFLLRLALAAAIVVVFALLSRAGGPKRVAGGSYFDPSVTGQPLIWPLGNVTYYTDQGDLSPLLPNAPANSFIADAFSQWNSVPTATLSITSGGQLAEDVNSSNVTVNGDGTVSIPLDIQPTATGTPVGVVYDADGSVTSALLGAGAGDVSQCFFNAVFGGHDNFGPLATYQHALIVINGQCAQQTSQLTDVEYRLVRVIGSILGLGWSQLNANVQTGTPRPTPDDYAGFPVMHYTDSWHCTPVTICYPNPFQLSVDDIAAISRLYPVTAANQASFPGKQILSSTTARIHGSVYFTDSHGNPTQPMQGVNVVARWIDPSSGSPSRRYAASSVSGFLFSGNQGNPITGFEDALGNLLTNWGSNNTALEGFFDLAGLPLPNGGSVQYQLTVEALDPFWSTEVGPYAPGPVSLSGFAQPITVTVSAGADVAQDILMTGSARPLQHPATSWTSPAALPLGGDWISTLSSYGETAHFLLPAQANRTLSVAATALDESGRASVAKAQPVIGMWAASDPEGAAPGAFTPSPFNQLTGGMTRLDAQVLTSGNFIVGIADLRGDGRPDYRYHARLLYADSVSPARVPVSGRVVTIQGIGFARGLAPTVGGTPATPLAITARQIVVAVPAFSEGPQDVTITDPVGGASSKMSGVLTYGADATDNLVLLGGSNPAIAVGTQAPNPMLVQVLAADAVTPVAGATIGWSASNGTQLSACGGGSSCSITTDESGNAATWLTPAATGVSTITATLAPGVYSPAKSVSEPLSAIESASDIGAIRPYLRISQGATVTLPLTVRVMSNGVPRTNVQVNFNVISGSGTLSATSAQTDASGHATTSVTVTEISNLAQVNACVAPGNAPCAPFYLNPVPSSQLRLQAVAGAGQITRGSFQPLVVGVVDSSSPPNPVIAAPVLFQTTILRPGGGSSEPGNGETNPGNPALPVILQVSDTTVASDANGLARISPSGGGFSPPVAVNVTTTAGAASLLFSLRLLP